ncbi:hypothetical protein B2K_14175 [Paenibacillus mucilaginosus K02]|uniref:Uncharacterized protein n=1 Tax=Paenibacillus mucilaginosus K02 TaxID=997761 RepID=I0BHK2_9BACL|nr:hypothetical protein B2K_14175 [Paenibacillus mucilaginosus K02]
MKRVTEQAQSAGPKKATSFFVFVKIKESALRDGLRWSASEKNSRRVLGPAGCRIHMLKEPEQHHRSPSEKVDMGMLHPFTNSGPLLWEPAPVTGMHPRTVPNQYR